MHLEIIQVKVIESDQCSIKAVYNISYFFEWFNVSTGLLGLFSVAFKYSLCICSQPNTFSPYI